MKFRKKQLVIEAVNWGGLGKKYYIGDNPESIDICPWISNDPESDCEHCNEMLCNHGCLETLEGPHRVCPGDWIIKGIEGELYPCKPSIFEASYEPAISE